MPDQINKFLNKLCTLRGIKKADLVREALLEYAENHKEDLIKYVTS